MNSARLFFSNALEGIGWAFTYLAIVVFFLGIFTPGDSNFLILVGAACGILFFLGVLFRQWAKDLRRKNDDEDAQRGAK